MKRFIDLRNTDVGMNFAWWDTIYDEFEVFNDSFAWDYVEEFVFDYEEDEGYELTRYRRLIPDWVPIKEGG